MLNADIAVVRTFGNQLNTNTGDVDCNFKDTNGCPASRLLSQAASYRNDNDLWVSDFKAALEKMLVNGYDLPLSCTSDSLMCLEEV